MTCVNLLRLNEQRRNEHLLTEKFDEVSLASTAATLCAHQQECGSAGALQHDRQLGMNLAPQPMAPFASIVGCNRSCCAVVSAGHDSKWHAMAQGLRSLQSASPRLPVRKYDFDWHFMLRELRDAGTVEAIWQKLEALLPESGLACGVMELATGGSDAAQAESTAGPRSPVRLPARLHVVRGMCGQPRHSAVCGHLLNAGRIHVFKE